MWSLDRPVPPLLPGPRPTSRSAKGLAKGMTPPYEDYVWMVIFLGLAVVMGCVLVGVLVFVAPQVFG